MPYNDPTAQSNAPSFSDEELNQIQRKDESNDAFKDRQDEFAQKFDKAELEEKVQASSDPMELLVKELKSLSNQVSNLEANSINLQDQIDDTRSDANEKPDVRDVMQVKGNGYNTIYPTGEGVEIAGEYNREFSCYIALDDSDPKVYKDIYCRAGGIWYTDQFVEFNSGDDKEFSDQMDSNDTWYVYMECFAGATPTIKATTNRSTLDASDGIKIPLCSVVRDSGGVLSGIQQIWDGGDIHLPIGYDNALLYKVLQLDANKTPIWDWLRFHA